MLIQLNKYKQIMELNIFNVPNNIKGNIPSAKVKLVFEVWRFYYRDIKSTVIVSPCPKGDIGTLKC